MTWKRVLTALVLIPAVVGIVLFTPTWVVALATAGITVLALREYFALGDAIGHRAFKIWTLFSAVLLVYSQYVIYAVNEGVDRDYSPILFDGGQLLQSVPMLFALGFAVIVLATRRPLVEVLPSAGISASALLLVAMPLSFAVRLQGIRGVGPRLLLFALVITWAADTTAYFVGRAIGKHPLAPHISPKKTWEGAVGSMVGSLVVAWGFSYWLLIPIRHLVVMAVIGNVAGQMGDLLESAYKRSAGVKDSGGLLPGHGGVLDRIDALILCIPVIWYYVVLVGPGMR
jgi:phosphatidate cytidylyltransferase